LRLTADLFVSALLRRIFADGGTGVIEARGAAQAGAVFIRVRHRDGAESLLAPAPQSLFDTARPEDRMFELRLTRSDAPTVSDLLARERRFDADIWIVEIETDAPDRYVTLAAP